MHGVYNENATWLEVCLSHFWHASDTSARRCQQSTFFTESQRSLQAALQGDSSKVAETHCSLRAGLQEEPWRVVYKKLRSVSILKALRCSSSREWLHVLHDNVLRQWQAWKLALHLGLLHESQRSWNKMFPHLVEFISFILIYRKGGHVDTAARAWILKECGESCLIHILAQIEGIADINRELCACGP